MSFQEEMFDILEQNSAMDTLGQLFVITFKGDRRVKEQVFSNNSNAISSTKRSWKSIGQKKV
jgi:hypothetical protein